MYENLEDALVNAAMRAIEEEFGEMDWDCEPFINLVDKVRSKMREAAGRLYLEEIGKKTQPIVWPTAPITTPTPWAPSPWAPSPIWYKYGTGTLDVPKEAEFYCGGTEEPAFPSNTCNCADNNGPDVTKIDCGGDEGSADYKMPLQMLRY